MNYKLVNGIKTAEWEGALIQDTYNRQYLTNGIYKWKLEPHRLYDVVSSIDVTAFMGRWNKYFLYSALDSGITEEPIA